MNASNRAAAIERERLRTYAVCKRHADVKMPASGMRGCCTSRWIRIAPVKSDSQAV
jgi:hypothetical protein